MSNEPTSQSEQWKPIAGYEGFYEVSDMGRVRSLARTIIRKNGRIYTIRERFLRPSPGSHGYMTICLSRKCIYDFRTIHTLVAGAFIPNPEPMRLKYVEHRNRNRTDNAISNLRWATQGLNLLNTPQEPRGKNRAIGVYEHSDGRTLRFAVRFMNKYRGSFRTEQEAIIFRTALYNDALAKAS